MGETLDMKMRKKTASVLLVLMGCSANPSGKGPHATPPVVAATTNTSAKPNQCVRSVYPSYMTFEDSQEAAKEQAQFEAEQAAAQAEEKAEREKFEAEEKAAGRKVEPIENDMGFSEMGTTLDDKDAEILKSLPDQGVCDNRHRNDLTANILRESAANSSKPASPRKTWDHKSALGYDKLVSSVLALSSEERAQLNRDGMVVPERLAYRDYTAAYYDIHRGQLPVFVSVDSIFHAIYASHDLLLANLERQQLIVRLDSVLGALHCQLAAVAKDYPSETAHDLDLYLTVARRLLSNTEEVPSELGGETDKRAAAIVALIMEPQGLQTIELFGRQRSFDSSQFTPRGHYAGNDGSLEQYFRAAMWLSRVEFNLVSRDTRSSQPGYRVDPTETPREAVDALALADLVTKSNATADLSAIDHAWTVFAGRREDVSVAELTTLRTKAGITKLTDGDVADKLRTAIGTGWQRTVNINATPNVPNLPAIATLIGPRVTADTVALGSLLSERGPQHVTAELGFMLGNDRSMKYVDANNSQTVSAMKDARIALSHATTSDDLYSAWLVAIRALAERSKGEQASFMDSDAYADMRLDSTIAAYAQLRHNHVLIQAQTYDEGGCEIPDGYVEPALETYQALALFAARGRKTFDDLDPKRETGGSEYFARIEKLMSVLVALSREELGNRPLSASAKQFLSMIVEQREATATNGYAGTTYPIATYDGWFIDLFTNVDTAIKDGTFIADYATFNRDGEQGVHYAGAKGPTLGVFVVDTGGAPRMMVGPVAQAFGYTGPIKDRIDDEAAKAVKGDSPWAASYVATAAKAPELKISFQRMKKISRAKWAQRGEQETSGDNTIHFDTNYNLGTVSVEVLDHHFTKMMTLTTKVNEGGTLKIPKTLRPVEGFRIRIGKFVARIDVDLEGRGYGEFTSNDAIILDDGNLPN
jgi:hypothetical protein